MMFLAQFQPDVGDPIVDPTTAAVGKLGSRNAEDISQSELLELAQGIAAGSSEEGQQSRAQFFQKQISEEQEKLKKVIEIAR